MRTFVAAAVALGFPWDRVRTRSGTAGRDSDVRRSPVVARTASSSVAVIPRPGSNPLPTVHARFAAVRGRR